MVCFDLMEKSHLKGRPEYDSRQQTNKNTHNYSKSCEFMQKISLNVNSLENLIFMYMEKVTFVIVFSLAEKASLAVQP